jgi:hypothetical protein
MPTTIYTEKSLSICSCIICKKEFNTKGINSHYITAHTIEGQKRIKQASDLGNNSRKMREFYFNKKELYIQTIENEKLEYNNNPNHCKVCSAVIPYEKKHNICCSKSHSATFRNKNRHPTKAAKKKTSDTLKARAKELYSPYTKIYFTICEICNKSFIWNSIDGGSKRFCSTECSSLHRSNLARINPGLGTKRSVDEIALFELCFNYFEKVTSNERLFNGWDADILIYDTKTAILWNGPWHYKEMHIGNHSLKQVQNRDRIKKEEIKNAGWNFVVFEDRHYTPITAFNKILLDFNCQ